MVKAELLHGAAKSANPEHSRTLVELFVGPFETVPFDDYSAKLYAQIRSELEQEGQVIGFNDLVIAATVMAHDGTLISSNIREFSRIKKLKLENWVEMSTLRSTAK
jgi:tRNA(fMet)-specific endonuclease VapC